MLRIVAQMLKSSHWKFPSHSLFSSYSRWIGINETRTSHRIELSKAFAFLSVLFVRVLREKHERIIAHKNVLASRDSSAPGWRLYAPSI